MLSISIGFSPGPGADAGDANDDGGLDIADPVFTLRFLFLDGSPPSPPFGQEGVDPSPDAVDCAGRG